MPTALMIIIGVGLLIGSGLVIWHLKHAPFGEETSEGFKETASPEPAETKLAMVKPDDSGRVKCAAVELPIDRHRSKLPRLHASDPVFRHRG